MFKKDDRSKEDHLKRLKVQQDVAMERIEQIRAKLNQVESALMLSTEPENPNVMIEVPHIDYLHETVMHLQDCMDKRKLYLSYLGHKVYS